MSFRKKNAAMLAAQAALVGNAAVWANAYAQADEILVTAQKREQSLQDVPLSITAISSADIERGGIIEFTDYAVRVPNLSFAYTVSTTGGAQSIAIRGVFGTGTTGVYIDDTPLPESVDPRVVELERIEVLRGPQGTLYGARSMGGTVRLITQQPDLSEHKARTHAWVNAVEDGDFDYGVDGAVNLPIIKDVLGLRLIGYGQFQSGFYDRKASALAPVDFGVNENVDDEVLFGGQASALLSLLDGRLEINPRFLYERRDRDGRSFADIRADNRVNERLFDIDEEANEEWELGALNIRFDTGAGDIVSSTSYFDRSFDDTEDFSELSSLLFGIPPTPSIIFARVDDERFSQEARFESAFGGPFELTAGLFYQDIETRLEFPPTPVPGVSPNIFRQILNTKIEEAAAFGEGSLRLTGRLQAIAGLRWFDNTVDFTGEQDGLAVFPDTFAGVQKEKGVNPKFGLQYDIDDDRMIYASAAKGFRIGGVNSFSNLLCGADLTALGLTAADVETFDSDSLWSYEIGAHTSWADNALRVNVAAFHIDWSNIQQRLPLGGCGFFVFTNAGAAESDGFELEVQSTPAEGLAININAGFTDARITDSGGFGVIQEGSPVQHVPRWTASALVDYDIDVKGLPAHFQASYSYVGESQSANNDTANPRVREAYDLLNLRLGARLNEIWEFTVFAHNVLDEAGNLSDTPPLAIELPGRPRIQATRPRTIGVEARVEF